LKYLIRDIAQLGRALALGAIPTIPIIKVLIFFIELVVLQIIKGHE
jgi:hypothetical protein